MKKVEAMVTLSAFNKLIDVLGAAGVRGITVTDVSRLAPTDRVLKVKVEAVVADGAVPQIVQALEKSADARRTPKHKVFVIDVEEAVRIRTGERGHGVV
jgi:nitrogen regulatory protein PII